MQAFGIVIRLCIAATVLVSCVSTRDALELDGDKLGEGFEDLRGELLQAKGDLETFRHDGPVHVDLQRNVALKLASGRTLIFDNVIPRSASPTPLVILVHGNHSRKEAHRYQAIRLASFGMHAVALEVPNRDQWITNGNLIAAFVQRIRKVPHILGGQIDPQRIILVGHSFGGSAITVAAAKGAKVAGLILLDPAVVGPDVEKALAKVRVPTLLLGADVNVFRSRHRSRFFRTIKAEMLEVSVTGATHDDAQGPSMYALTTFGVDPYTSPERQGLFAAAITAGAFSLTATGGLDFVSEATSAALSRGLLKDARHRSAALDTSSLQ